MITRFETITINSITTSKSAFGEQSVTETLWFKTRAKVHEVNSAIDIKDLRAKLLEVDGQICPVHQPVDVQLEEVN